MTDDVIKARVDARQRAELLLELASMSAADCASDDARLAFWDAVRRAAEKFAPAPIAKISPVVEPMSDEEAKAFEKQRFPWGKYADLQVANVAISDPRYLLWMADSDQGFTKQVKRYVLNKDVARHINPDHDD